jgi:hypothetical protein
MYFGCVREDGDINIPYDSVMEKIHIHTYKYWDKLRTL